MTEQEEKKLFELELSVAKGKKRIRDLYNQTSGACYLSFSGGKDSTVVLALIKLCEEDGDIPKNAIPAVFCNTKIGTVTYRLLRLLRLSVKLYESTVSL